MGTPTPKHSVPSVYPHLFSARMPPQPPQFLGEKPPRVSERQQEKKGGSKHPKTPQSLAVLHRGCLPPPPTPKLAGLTNPH